MIATCGHPTTPDDAVTVTTRDTARCGCPCIATGTYCPTCAAELVAAGDAFADDAAADEWLMGLAACGCWE